MFCVIAITVHLISQISQPEDRVIDEKSFDVLVEQFYGDLWRLLDQSFNFPFSSAQIHLLNSDINKPKSAVIDDENGSQTEQSKKLPNFEW
ncbi:MAG: hypothetical protein ACE5OZ_16210 [Candidatus Heimdallarchaeota archaeon]